VAGSVRHSSKRHSRRRAVAAVTTGRRCGGGVGRPMQCGWGRRPVSGAWVQMSRWMVSLCSAAGGGGGGAGASRNLWALDPAQSMSLAKHPCPRRKQRRRSAQQQTHDAKRKAGKLETAQKGPKESKRVHRTARSEPLKGRGVGGWGAHLRARQPVYRARAMPLSFACCSLRGRSSIRPGAHPPASWPCVLLHYRPKKMAKDRVSQRCQCVHRRTSHSQHNGGEKQAKHLL
jgi:hypothetical protein